MVLFFNGSFAENACFFLHTVSVSPECILSVRFALFCVRGLPQALGVLVVTKGQGFAAIAALQGAGRGSRSLALSFPSRWSGRAVWGPSGFTSFVSTWAAGILQRSLPDPRKERKVLGAERVGRAKSPTLSKHAYGLWVPSFRHGALILACASRFPDPKSSVLPAPENELQTSAVV